jgi:hypothetical protein
MVIKELYNSDAQFHDEQYSIFFYQTSMALKHGFPHEVEKTRITGFLKSKRAFIISGDRHISFSQKNVTGFVLSSC